MSQPDSPYSNSGGISQGTSFQLPFMSNAVALPKFSDITTKIKGALTFSGSSMSPSTIAGLVFLVFVIAGLVYTWVRAIGLKQRETGAINTIETARKLQTINDKIQDQPLRNFYVKTALNCCCLGEWKNNYVDISALQYAIMQGYRCLDFEIYSRGNVPVVSASKKNSYYYTETFNDLDFKSVCQHINDNAFTQAPNGGDPLLINLRIKSNNPRSEFVKGIIDGIKVFPDARRLAPEYNYEFGGENLGKIPINNFMGKVIIMTDVSNPVVKQFCGNSQDPSVSYCLHQYINIATTSPFLHHLEYQMDVKNAPSMDDLIDHNKKNMSIVFPDPPFNKNVDFNVAKIFGCQLIGMMPQLKDANLETYNGEFNDAGSAFKLKPSELCYQPVVVETPPPQNPALSFAGRNYSTDYASWSV